MVKANSDSNVNVQAVKIFTEFLEKKSLRRTPERMAVLDCILTINKHFTVEDLKQLMDDGPYRVSRATLYNTIELLLECEVLRKNIFDGLTPQYEIRTAIPHSHLVCTCCGKVKEVKDNTLTAFMNARKYTAFNTSYYKIVIYGTCSTCMRRLKREARLAHSNTRK